MLWRKMTVALVASRDETHMNCYKRRLSPCTRFSLCDNINKLSFLSWSNEVVLN